MNSIDPVLEILLGYEMTAEAGQHDGSGHENKRQPQTIRRALQSGLGGCGPA
jgi:hypothetical protein